MDTNAFPKLRGQNSVQIGRMVHKRWSKGGSWRSHRRLEIDIPRSNLYKRRASFIVLPCRRVSSTLFEESVQGVLAAGRRRTEKRRHDDGTWQIPPDSIPNIHVVIYCGLAEMILLVFLRMKDCAWCFIHSISQHTFDMQDDNQIFSMIRNALGVEWESEDAPYRLCYYSYAENHTLWSQKNFKDT